MGETMLGDIVFILLVSGLIYCLMALKKSPPKGKLTGDMSATDDRLREIFGQARNVAVMSVSAEQHEAAGRTVSYLEDAGYRVFLVGPEEGSIAGRICFRKIEEVSEPIDIVGIFDLPDEPKEIARSAAGRGASVLWLEKGVLSPEAMETASDAGLTVVMDRSLEEEHRRLTTAV